MSELTVVLLNWKRPRNLICLLETLHHQTLKPKIFLWNNGDKLDGALVDVLVNSSKNMRCWPRWFLGSLSDTKYVCAIDDDLALGDHRVLEDLVKCMNDDDVADRVYGLEGLIIGSDGSYRSGRPPASVERLAPVDIVKGRMMAVHGSALETIGMHRGVTEDDIAICGLLAKGRRGFHRQVRWLRGRVTELPETDALAHQPGHYDRRDAAVAEFCHVNPT